MRQSAVFFVCMFMAIFVAVDVASAQTPTTAPVLRKKPVPEPSQFDNGCRWVGQKSLTSILREDIVAANELIALYERFDCPKPHLRLAFDCAVTGIVPEKPELMTARIKACWLDPVTASASASGKILPNLPSATPPK